MGSLHLRCILCLYRFQIPERTRRKTNIEDNQNFKMVTQTYVLPPTWRWKILCSSKMALLWATPLFLVLILGWRFRCYFAVDSIPCNFCKSSDPFIVLTANLMAILGLRAMFFPVGWCHNQTALPTVWTGHHLIVYRYENVIAGCVPHANLDFIELYRTGTQYHRLSIITS